MCMLECHSSCLPLCLLSLLFWATSGMIRSIIYGKGMQCPGLKPQLLRISKWSSF